MAFARASTVRGAVRTIRTTRQTLARPQFWRQTGRRGYASGGHEHAKAGSDIPWLIGSIAVTVPSAYYLWPAPSDTAHHGGHGDSHDAGHEKEHHDESEEKEEPKEDDSASEKSESSDEGKEADTPETSDDEGGDSKGAPAEEESTDDAKESEK